MRSFLRLFLILLAAACGLCLRAGEARAASCNVASAPGATGPANWQTYCCLDFAGYSDAAARSAAGQAMSYTLSDGTVLTFTLKVAGAAINAVAAPPIPRRSPARS